MKITLITEEDRTQVCLHPESEYDSSVLDSLESLPNTHRTSLYERQGGYTAFDSYRGGDMFGGGPVGEDLLIVFDPENDKTEATDPVDGAGGSGEHKTPQGAS
jgi:hypothetical protein